MILEYFLGYNKKNLIKKIDIIINELVIEYEKEKNIDKIIQEFDLTVANITNDETLKNNMKELLKKKIFDKYDNIKDIIINVDDYYTNHKSSLIFVWYYDNKYYFSRLLKNNFNMNHESKISYLIELLITYDKDSEKYIINKYCKLFGNNKIVNLLN